MVGRAGAYTADGAKGIAFEIKYMDLENLKNLFTGMMTSLEESSTNAVSDLVTSGKGGEIIDRIQCKTATSKSGINKIVEQVTDGKYDNVRLAGTTECAEVYNEAAMQNGLPLMEDSGISAKSAEQTAERFLNPGSNASQALRAVGRAGAVGAVIKGTCAIYESVRRGDNVNELIAHVMTEAPKGAITGAAACMAGDTVVVALTLAGISNPVILIIGAGAVSIAAAIPMELGLDKLADKLNVEGKLTGWVTIGTESVSAFANGLMEKIDVSSIGNWVSNAANSAKSSVKGMWEKAVNIGN